MANDQGGQSGVNIDPGDAAAAVVAGGIGIVANGLAGTIGAVKELKSLAIAVPNGIVQTAAGVEGEVAGGADRGMDKALDGVNELLQEAQQRLQAAVREFGAGLPDVHLGGGR